MPFGGRENALSFLPQLIEEGLGNTEIVRFLREQGLGYRTQEMFRDINQFRLENFGASFIPSLPQGEAIPERFMRTWEGDVSYEYRAVVKFEYLDVETGTVKVSGTTLYFDEPPTQEEVTALFEARRESIADRYSDEIAEIYGATKVQYFHNVTPNR